MSFLRLGVLGSGKGSNFLALARSIAEGRLSAKIELVASDLPQAGILDHAQGLGLPTFSLPQSRFRTKLEPELETGLAEMLLQHQVEWVVLAGYMRVIKAPLLEAFPNRIINIHPSLLPNFKGLHAWKQALDAGATEAGCTVHLVNEEVDGGRILGQSRVPVHPGDTPESLHARIQVAEHELFPRVLQEVALHGISFPPLKS